MRAALATITASSLSIAACTMTPVTADDAAAPGGRVDASRFTDKITVGYNGSFAADGDGAMRGWAGWTEGGKPDKNNVRFELYPDLRDYAEGDLAATALPALGDGRPAALFSSHTAGAMDVHFRWLAEHDLDGAAILRPLADLADPGRAAFRNHVAEHARAAAEKHGRIFYVEYDLTGAPPGNWVQLIRDDFGEVIAGRLALVASQQYAKHDGRPVVFVRGLGFADRPGTAEEALSLVDWLAARAFVGAAVPPDWRTGANGMGAIGRADFDRVYERLDSIRPLIDVSAAPRGEAAIERDLAARILPDKRRADANGVAYQVVLVPGFATSNRGRGEMNAVPRDAGRFFWAQARAARAAEAGAFIATLDGYDDATAIGEAAEDSKMRPAEPYFLTLDADGTKLSSDFYLRLAGAAARMIRFQSPAYLEIPIPRFPGEPAPMQPDLAMSPPDLRPPPDLSTPPPPDLSMPPPPDLADPDPVPLQMGFDMLVRTYSQAQANLITTRLYRALLGREPDAGGLANWAAQVAAGRLPRAASGIMTSGEFEGRRPGLTGSGLAETLYQKILDRPSDPGGLAGTAAAIRAGTGPRRIVDMFLSPEYEGRNP